MSESEGQTHIESPTYKSTLSAVSVDFTSCRNESAQSSCLGLYFFFCSDDANATLDNKKGEKLLDQSLTAELTYSTAHNTSKCVLGNRSRQIISLMFRVFRDVFLTFLNLRFLSFFQHKETPALLMPVN